MDPSTALAVVSLAIQLAGTVQSINEFLRTVRDAPSELLALIESLDLMQSNMCQVRSLNEQQFFDARLGGSPVFILKALQMCERRVKALSDWINEVQGSLRHQRLVKRTWASLNMLAKKIKIQDLQNQIRDAMSNLHLALTNNIMQLQLHQIQMATSQHTVVTNQLCTLKRTEADSLSMVPQNKFQSAQHDQERVPVPSVSRPAFSMTSRQVNNIWYQGFFGIVEATTTSKFLGSSRFRIARKPVLTERIISIRALLLKRIVEIYFGASFFSIPRALRVYQVIEDHDQIWSMCGTGDLEGFQTAFADGSISPFAITRCGETLLTLAATYCQPELCSFLLRLGLNPDQVSGNGSRKAIERASWGAYLNRYKSRDVVDTFRILAQAQKDLSTTDISDIFEVFESTPNIADLILSLDEVKYELLSAGPEEIIYPALGTALREYGRMLDPTGWSSFIRRLIRIGVDIHAPVPRRWEYCFDIHLCILNPYGTPLDELFTYIRTPHEAKSAANAWLQILLLEGYDVHAYLEEERALHNTQPHFTCPNRFYWLEEIRHLVFDFGDTPSVYADLWFDPKSPIFLVSQEFKDMDIFSDMGTPWVEAWPISYPQWEWDYGYGATRAPCELAQERAERRWQKKARKAARLNGTHICAKMPGAWPGQ